MNAKDRLFRFLPVHSIASFGSCARTFAWKCFCREPKPYEKWTKNYTSKQTCTTNRVNAECWQRYKRYFTAVWHFAKNRAHVHSQQKLEPKDLERGTNKELYQKWSIYTHTYINLFYWDFCIKTLVSHWVHLGSAVENENKASSAHSDSHCHHLRCFKRENNDSTSMAPLNLLKTACESCEGWRCNLFPRKPYFRLLETALPQSYPPRTNCSAVRLLHLFVPRVPCQSRTPYATGTFPRRVINNLHLCTVLSSCQCKMLFMCKLCRECMMLEVRSRMDN